MLDVMCRIEFVYINLTEDWQSTPPKSNMEPEYDGFQEELPVLGTSFQVPC